jgi:hypothetical protein
MNIYLATQQGVENARKAQQDQFDRAYSKNHPPKPASTEFNWEDRKSFGVSEVCSLYAEAVNIKSVGTELASLIKFADPSNLGRFYDAVKATFDEHSNEFPAIVSFLKEYELGLHSLIKTLRYAILGLNISEA